MAGAGIGQTNRILSAPAQTMIAVGSDKSFTLPKNFLLIDDGEFIDTLDFPGRNITVFDPSVHGLAPLNKIDHRRARNLGTILYSSSPQGENTLTVRNGKRALTRLFLTRGAKLDDLPYDKSDAHQEAKGMIDDLLLSPVLRNVLLRPRRMSFKGIVLVRLNPSELGEEDCKVLGNIFLELYEGIAVVPDFGLYAAAHHAPLVRQDRIIAGVNFLDELPPKLKNLFLLGETVPSGCTYDDAEVFALYAGLARGTGPFTDYVRKCIKV